MSRCENLDGQCAKSWCNCDEVRKRRATGSFAAPLGYVSGVDEIESQGLVVGCDATEQTITVKISTRPSGVRIGDECLLKWKRHPLTHNTEDRHVAKQ